MSVPLILTEFDYPDKIKYKLFCQKVAAPAYSPPDEGWSGEGLSFYFSAQIDGTWWDFIYEETNDTAEGFHGQVKAVVCSESQANLPLQWTGRDIEALTCLVIYQNPIIPLYSSGLWKAPVTSAEVAAAWLNFRLTLTGTTQVRTYTAGEYVDNEPADLPTNAKLGLLGVNVRSRAETSMLYDYAYIDSSALPNMPTADHEDSLDVTELVKCYYDTIKPTYDGFAIWPMIEGFTVTPGTVLGPKFMQKLFEACYTNDILLSTAPGYSGTVTMMDYDWGHSILNIAEGRMTLTARITIPPKARVSYGPIPPGVPSVTPEA